MHTRQSGAAHVPIMLFIVVMVMFLAAVGFAYKITNDNAELQKKVTQLDGDNKTLNGKVTLFTHYTEDLGRVIDLPGKYEGRAEAKDIYSGSTLDGVAGVVSPADLKKRMKGCTDAVQLTEQKGIEGLCSQLVALVNDKIQREKDISAARDQALADKEVVDKKFNESATEHGKAAGEWSAALGQANAAYAAAKSEKDGTISSLNSSITQANDSLNQLREQTTAEKKVMNNEINRLRSHNNALTSKDKLRMPADVAKGKVVAAKQGVSSAFINLGRKDMLQPDTIFVVRAPKSTKVKAYATVTRVEQEKAEVLLTGVVDPIGDAVNDGDELYNDLFSPNGANKRVIYMMGRFSYPYNKDMIEKLLKRLGNTVVTKMGPGVDTVLLGDNAVNEAGDGFALVTDSAEFKLANDLGVEFVPLRKVIDLLKL
jgi:hypothetical protein